MARPRSRSQEMNARLAAVVAASSDAIIPYAMDTTILTWNPAAERMFGYAAAEVIGQPMACNVPPEQAHEPEALFARLRAGDDPVLRNRAVTLESRRSFTAASRLLRRTTSH
jgi:PAS domain S-box-containing protein